MQSPIDEIVVRYSVEAGNGFPAELLSFEALGLPELSNEGWFSDLRTKAPEKFREVSAKLSAWKASVRKAVAEKFPRAAELNKEYEEAVAEQAELHTATEQSSWMKRVMNQQLVLAHVQRNQELGNAARTHQQFHTGM